VIQAADGRRMSKSLGTGIDPVEMIEKYGADATRFAMLLMSSSQDVRFSEEKIVMGRGFANKLWNASRLVLLASEGLAAERSDAHQVDRWITSRFQRCLAEVEAAVTVFDFAEAVDTLYHFVWDEFCDWYLELVKVRLYSDDEVQRAQAGGHARWLLAEIVRLLHPFLPFVTEEVAAQYGEAPLLERQHPLHDESLLAPGDEAVIGELQTVVEALRRFRAEAEVPPGKVLAAVFVAEGGGAAGRYAPYAAAFRALARTDVRFDGAPDPDATVVLVPGGRLEVVAVVDRAEETARLEQQLVRIEAEIERGEAKLANAGFTSCAPVAVVSKERDKLAAHVADRDELAARGPPPAAGRRTRPAGTPTSNRWPPSVCGRAWSA
jgi:valyl-tRNA synthetase